MPGRENATERQRNASGTGPQTWKEFTVALADSYALYGRKLAPGSAVLFCRALQARGIEPIDAGHALAQHIADPERGQYAPRPADLIAQLVGTSEQHADAAATAWADLLEAARRYGAYRSIQINDPRMAAGLRAVGGWVELCQATADQRNVMQATFRRAYVDASRRPVNAEPVLMSGRHGGRAALRSKTAQIGDIINTQNALEANNGRE